MTKSMKRIHTVVIRRIPEFPDRHSDLCIAVNDKRAQYDCECETIGIRAEATIGLPNSWNANSSTMQWVTSGGLWGIESDSDAAYLKEIEEEQLSELRDQLHAIGFSNRAISAAMRDLRREEN